MATETRSKSASQVSSAAANGKNGHSLISDEKFRQLYELTLRINLRAKDEGERWLQGQEAILAGVVADLRAGDVVIAEQAGSMEKILCGVAQRMARRDFEHSVIDVLSAALSGRVRKTGSVSVILSEGAEKDGLLREAREIAGAARLPLLFVERNRNARADGRRTAKKCKDPRTPAAFPMISVDARDVIAMYRVAHESIERARDLSGPTQIVAMEWKVDARARAKGAAKLGALERLEEWLIARGLQAQEWRKKIESELRTPLTAEMFTTEHPDRRSRAEAETRAIV